MIWCLRGALMAALSSLQQHRHGMIYHEQDDSSSGEFPESGQSRPSPTGAHRRPSDRDSSPAPPRCSPRTAGSEGSYEEIYSSSGEDSYHSECDDIAEYWDPYCKLVYLIRCIEPWHACMHCTASCSWKIDTMTIDNPQNAFLAVVSACANSLKNSNYAPI